VTCRSRPRKTKWKGMKLCAQITWPCEPNSSESLRPTRSSSWTLLALTRAEPRPLQGRKSDPPAPQQDARGVKTSRQVSQNRLRNEPQKRPSLEEAAQSELIAFPKTDFATSHRRDPHLKKQHRVSFDIGIPGCAADGVKDRLNPMN
jgi:hypothetical protein